MILFLGLPALVLFGIAAALWTRDPHVIPVGHPHHSVPHVAKCLHHPDYEDRWRLLFRCLAVGAAALGNAFLLALCLYGR